VVLGNNEVEFLLWVLGIRGEFRGLAKPTESPMFETYGDEVEFVKAQDGLDTK